MAGPGARKDPVIATFLSLVFPGAGYLYVGNPARAFMVFALVFGLLCWGRSYGVTAALVLHFFFAVAAGGAAKAWNVRNADLPPPPPLPSAGATRGKVLRTDAWSVVTPHAEEPPPVPQGAQGPPLAADEFLAELRAAWSAQRAGTATDAEFAAMKRSAIERVKVRDWEDGVALLEATSALVGAGVMTGDERNRLKLKVGQS